MYREDIEATSNTVKKKLDFLNKNPLGYFLMSMIAGMFIGFGILLTFTISGLFNGAAATKLVMGVFFAAALSLVVFAGGELFTGNVMVMTVGNMQKKVKITDTFRLLVVCFIGNLVGSILLSVIFHFTGLDNGATGEVMAAATIAKCSVSALKLITRGILCNMLVCLAVWCCTRCKNEVGKLIMIIWCITIFVTCGFEHCVANMTLFTSALINPCGNALSLSGCLYNILMVTIGNIIGGAVFTAFPYVIAAREK